MTPPRARKVSGIRLRLFFLWVLFITGLLPPLPILASPEQDLSAFREFYHQRFPALKLTDYAAGVYAIDPIARKSWQAIEEFPPYESAVEQGKKLFETPFGNGKGYSSCFPQKGIGIANNYPKWDNNAGEVLTLPLAINQCRIRHHQATLQYDSAEMVALSAYMAYTSRGKPIRVTIPANDPRAVAAYEEGKTFYYTRHGQLNFACATCHVQNAGKKLRAEILGAGLGHTSNWPTYRLKWGETGSLHRRFAECLTQIKAKPFAEQSAEFRHLEYFLSYMGNGVPISGPSTRK